MSQPPAMKTNLRTDAQVVRKIVTLAIRSSSKNREEIAAEMSSLLTTTVTKRSLDSYTAEVADQNRFPAQYIRAFCEVVGDYKLLRELCKRSGFRMIGPEEEELLEIGRAYVAKVKAERKLAGVAL